MDWNHAARQFLRQSLTLVITHNDKKPVVFGFFDPMNNTYVRMI